MAQNPPDSIDHPLEAPPANPLVHLIAPIAAIGATLLVRKLLNTGYERMTGKEPPQPRDPDTTFARALLWTAITAATAAVVEVAVYRIASQMGPQRTAS